MKAKLTTTQATTKERKSLVELTLENGRVVYSSYAPEGNEAGINKAITEYGIKEIIYEKGIFLTSFINSLNVNTIKELT